MKRSATTPKSTGRPGNTLLMAVIFLLAISVMVLSLYDQSAQQISTTSRRINDPVTTSIAESGIEKAVWCLNNPAASGTICPRDGQGKYVGETNTVFGRGSYSSIISVSGSTAIITVTATTTGLGGTSSKTIQATLVQAASINPSLQFGVQSGEGGVVMSNNASVIGNVYTNGSIIGGNGSSVTGDAILAVSAPDTDAVSDPAVSPLLTKNIGDASNTVYIAQKFLSSVNDTIYSLDLKLAKHGVAPPGLTAYIYTDDNGAPGTNLSGSGQSLDAGFPYDSPGGWEGDWTSQIFTPSTIILENTPYWLVLKSASSNSSKYWTTVRDADDTVYPLGTAKIGSTLGSLTALNYDLAFQINTGGEYPTLNAPIVGGSAYSHFITNTAVGKHAYYTGVNGVVTANGGAETCSLTPGPFCHPSATDQPPQNFPISDAQIAQMEAVAAAGGTVTCTPTCTIGDGAFIGPKKYIGDVQIINNAVVTLTGTIWVQGNIVLDNNVILQLDPGYGSSNGVFIADNPNDRVTSSKITFTNNGDLRGNANASCTGSPLRCSDGLNKNNSCTTAADCPINSIMAISMNADPTFLNSGILVSNNLTAGVIYAPNGLATISQNASLKEVTAQKLALENNATIRYMTGLASAIFTSGPGASWQIQPGTYQIIN